MSYITKVLFYLWILLGILHAETEQRYIKEILLEGNDNVSMNEVLYIVRQRPPNFFFRKPEFDDRLLRLDALTLKNYYHSKGFLDVLIDDSFTEIEISDKKYVNILFTINEGKQYYLSKVNIDGNSLLGEERIKELLGLSLNKPYNPVGLNDNLYLLENEYHELGKLYFDISIKDIVDDSVSVNVSINEGNTYYLRSTAFERTGNIDSSLILRELKYQAGDLYSKSIMDKTSKQLREIGIFSTANLIPTKVADSDSLVDIFIDLKRYKQREWNSSGGLVPISFADGANEIDAVSAIIEWRDRAFLNSPKQFSMKLLAGFTIDTSFVASRLRYDASLSTNWFLGIRFPTKIIGYYEKFIFGKKTDFPEGIDRFGANLAQRVQLMGRSYFETRTIWERFSDRSEENIEERSISLKINIDRKDDPLFTKKGYLLQGLIKKAGFDGSRDYFKTDVTLQSYYSLSKGPVCAMRIQYGRLWQWSQTYEDYSFEKFYLGGSTSMRGWQVLKFSVNEQGEPNGGITRLMANFELRQHVYKSFGMTLFSDGGFLSDEPSNYNLIGKMRWDVGLGLTFETPLGPARFDYAIQIDDLNKQQFNIGVQNLF